MDLSQNELARALKVPPRRINEIVLGKRAVSADTDLRTDFDLMERRREIAADLKAIAPRRR